MTLRVENAEMNEQINKPIFVVGSPRSGTSILAWCLGHHPNIFPVPESNWMGDFAVNVAIAHQIGSARGGLSILSAMDIRDDEFFAAFGQSVNELVLGHRRRLEINRENSNSRSKVNRRWLEATSMAAGPKTRWVDGTPEYSLHICGLRKLFPEARFVHLFRDVEAVVRSMVNFHRATGIQLVATEEEAYRYWLRMVDACLKAEQSYGPHVVYRLPYAALIDNPEAAMRSLLDFVEEPYSAKCLEPLAQRINSSNVSADFKSGDPATDPKVVEAARRLYVEIQQTPQPAEASRIIADQLEAAFQEPYLKATRLQQELSEQIAKGQHYAAEVERYKSQLARQEEHYTGEIDVLKSQVARQEQHYTNEIDVLKSRLARQEQHYTGEIDVLKSQVTRQEQHYTGEIDVLESQVTRQEQHYTGEIDVLESQIARQEQHYTAEIEKYKARLDSLHTHTTNLSRLLDDVQNAADRLANSRRWKLLNVGTVIKAKLSGDKGCTGYDPLDKIVAAYSRWRASHPEIGKLE